MKFRIWGLALVVMIMFMSSTGFTEGVKFGVGISATESSDTIYIPIKIPVRKKFVLIEPMIAHVKTKETDNYDATATYGAFQNKFDRTETDLGAGIYLLSGIYQNTYLMLGARIFYIKAEQKGAQYSSVGSAQLYDYDQKGYSLAPVLGLEYNVNDHISIGGTVAFTYSKITGDNQVYNTGYNINQPYDSKVESYSTHTDLFVKYYF